MKKSKLLLSILLLLPSIFIFACQSIEVNGKTFTFNKVTIDWGLAQEKEEKQLIYDKFNVSNKSQLIEYLTNYKNRSNRITTFGVDNKYYTKNENNEILDQGYYRQDESVITLAESEEMLDDNGAYTLKANTKGYIVVIKLDDDLKVFARYEYIEQT